MARTPATPETHERPHNRVYRGIFRDHNGPPPYTCHKCQQQMSALEVVHHHDEDPWNNHPDNLFAMHYSCHNQEHHVGITMTEESNRKRRETFRATVATMTSEERQAKYNQSERLLAQGKVSCLFCRRVVASWHLKHHQRAKGCAPWPI